MLTKVYFVQLLLFLLSEADKHQVRDIHNTNQQPNRNCKACTDPVIPELRVASGISGMSSLNTLDWEAIRLIQRRRRARRSNWRRRQRADTGSLPIRSSSRSSSRRW